MRILRVMKEASKQQIVGAWDEFWQFAGADDQPNLSGVNHAGVPALWKTFLRQHAVVAPDASYLDIATGDGAVLDAIADVEGASLERVWCIDASDAVVSLLESKYPAVTPVCADAADLPFEDNRFDLVTSQFGIEYSTDEAIDEAVRVLAPNGHLFFMMHVTDGIPCRESKASLDALRRIETSKFLTLSREFFAAGFDAVRGADRAAYDAAGVALNPAIDDLTAILEEYGEDVAGGSVIYLLDNVQRIHERIAYHDPDEVLGWIDGLQTRFAAFVIRLESMLNAAKNEDEITAVCDHLRKLGLTIQRKQPLHFDNGDVPFAWVLHASAAE